LIDSAGTLKIGDFGLSRFKSESDDMTGHTGSYRWMAPEVVRNEKYSEKVDVYR
jgi:serine/threonine protein kinase